jgi:predicted enzyme related to lactoylglutathione lyase
VPHRPNGTEIHVYGPVDEDHCFFGTAPVVGLLVDDVDRTRAAMEAAGMEFLGPIQRAEGSRWNHFRGPDGNVYGIMSGP